MLLQKNNIFQILAIIMSFLYSYALVANSYILYQEITNVVEN